MSATEQSRNSTEIEKLRARVAQLEHQLAHQSDIEQKLRQSEANRAVLLQNTPLAAIAWDAQFNVREWNPAAERIFGFSRNAAMSRSADDLIIPASERERVSEIFHGIVTHRRSFQGRWENVTQEGRRVVCEWHCAPMLGPNDEVIGVASLAHDISKQQQQERALRESESRLRVLVEQMPAILWTTDNELRFTSIVGAGLSALNLKPNQLNGTILFDYVRTTDQSFPAVAAHRCALIGRSVTFQQEWEDRVFQAYVEPLVEPGGKVAGTIGVALDITKRHEAESALRESEERFRQMAESIPEIFYLRDPRDQQILYVNRAYEQIWGRSRHSVYSDPSSWQEAIHWEDRIAFHANLEIIFRGNEVLQHYRILMPDGSVRWIEDQSFPVRDDNGNVYRIAGICADITERKLAEQALREARDELEKRVAERTEELRKANDRLRRDITQRERINRQLRESEERFRTTAQTMPIPVVITRVSDGTILYANRCAEATFGVSGDNTLDELAAVFSADGGHLIQRLSREGEARDVEIQTKRADGVPLWLSVSLQPISYQGERAVLAGLVDFTERKRADQSLRKERRLLQRLLDLHERDRQLVAYEIHDGMVQDITAATMFLEASLPQISTESPEVQHNLANAVKLLQGSIGEARRLINGLRPPVLEDQGLVAAVENLVEEIEATASLSIELHHDVHFQRIAPALEMAIYRVVQEGLNNVWQHSESRRARVELIHQDDRIIVSVRDWGIGFDPSQVNQKCYGLRGVEERARLLGGRATTTSSPGQGTTIEVELPLADLLLPIDAADGGIDLDAPPEE